MSTITSDTNIDHIDYIVITCPHCQLEILIYREEINCRIFRHGVYKDNMEQIPPHLDKATCDMLLSSDRIYGCGKPFILNGEIAERCDYI